MNTANPQKWTRVFISLPSKSPKYHIGIDLIRMMEVLLTIMSSLAQEESRSISQNVTWGQRRRFAAGRASVAFSSFLGYEKGEDGKWIVNEEQAETVKLIYGLFLEGNTYSDISRTLESRNILTPGGKAKWSISTIRSILSNEKYRGDALLQISNPNPTELTPFNDYTGQSLKRVKSTITIMPVLGGISADFIVDSATYHGKSSEPVEFSLGVI